jgi:hypothetical protein
VRRQLKQMIYALIGNEHLLPVSAIDRQAILK